jgi:hypothetical protein
MIGVTEYSFIDVTFIFGDLGSNGVDVDKHATEVMQAPVEDA